MDYPSKMDNPCENGQCVCMWIGPSLYKIFVSPAMKNVTKSSNISSIPTPGSFSVNEIN